MDTGYFLIFINYSWHSLQTLLISWKHLYFLKAYCTSSLAEMRPAFRPDLLFPTSMAILSSGPSWCHRNYEYFARWWVGTQLDLAQFETQGFLPIILTSAINSLLKTGGLSLVHFHRSLYVALSCELYLESQISLLGETICLCLYTTSRDVLEIISRVGAIVELTLLAPLMRNPFSAAWCLV